MIGDTRNSFTGLSFINLFNFINLTEISFSSLEIHGLFYIALSTLFVFVLVLRI